MSPGEKTSAQTVQGPDAGTVREVWSILWGGLEFSH